MTSITAITATNNNNMEVDQKRTIAATTTTTTNSNNNSSSMVVDQNRKGPEIMVIGGSAVKQGKIGSRGWLDIGRGINGYSSSKKSVYVITVDDNGNEVAYANLIRSSSIDFRDWTNTTNSSMEDRFLCDNPKVAKTIAELVKVLRECKYESETHGPMLLGALLEMIEERVTCHGC